MIWLKSKRGDERLLSVWMFAIWIFIGIAIIGGVIMFYSAEGDMRQLQADSLKNRISYCVDSGGFVNSNFFKEDFNIFNECNLDEYVISNSNDFYFNMSLLDDAGNSREFVYGNRDFAFQCALRKSATAENFALCSSDEFELNKFEGGRVVVKIQTGSNYEGGKI